MIFLIFGCKGPDGGGDYYTCPTLVEWFWSCTGVVFHFFLKGPDGGGGGGGGGSGGFYR